jgi:hypothetical protein
VAGLLPPGEIGANAAGAGGGGVPVSGGLGGDRGPKGAGGGGGDPGGAGGGAVPVGGEAGGIVPAGDGVSFGVGDEGAAGDGVDVEGGGVDEVDRSNGANVGVSFFVCVDGGTGGGGVKSEPVGGPEAPVGGDEDFGAGGDCVPPVGPTGAGICLLVGGGGSDGNAGPGSASSFALSIPVGGAGGSGLAVPPTRAISRGDFALSSGLLPVAVASAAGAIIGPDVSPALPAGVSLSLPSLSFFVLSEDGGFSLPVVIQPGMEIGGVTVDDPCAGPLVGG